MIKNPKNPIVPMVAITGNPSKEYIYSVIENNKRVGIEQFLIYPRAGIKVGYLSKEWFDICRTIIIIAKEFDVDVWLYDELNWPSGRCDQRVVESNPELIGYSLELIIEDDNCDIKLIKGKTTDILNPLATDKFIELTHERYAEEFSEYFGNTIKGFFTDEPSPFHNCVYDNAGVVCIEDKKHRKLPYYIDMDIDYNNLTQRNLIDDVKSFMEGSDIEGFGAVYYELIGNKMKSSYVDKIRIWCEKHNLISTGHFFHEDTSYKAAQANGNLLNNLIGMSMPSIDEIVTNTSFDDFLWETFASVKYACDTVGRCGMIELFALGPCSMPLSKIRQMIWLSASFGLDHYLLAVSALDASGNKTKMFYYNPNNYMQPWFEAFKELSNNFSKAAIYANKKDDRSIEIRYSQSFGANEAMKKTRDDNYKPYVANVDLYKKLSAHQFQWHIIKEDDESSKDAKAVIKVLANGFLEENSGTYFENMEKLVEFLEIEIKRDTVIDENGKLASNVLVKTYKDESVLVIDMSDDIYDNSYRQLTFKQDDRTKSFQLYKRGVATFDRDSKNRNLATLDIPLVVDEMEIELCNNNYVRCIFDINTKTYNFECKHDIEDIKLAILNQGEICDVLLDENKVYAKNKCTQLRKGFNNLYKTTESISLSKGRHKIKIDNNAHDYLFLPAVILCGSFYLYDNNIINNFNKSVQIGSLKNKGLLNYAGTIRLTTDIYIPDTGKDVMLQVNTFGNYTKAYINDKPVTTRGWAPFVFDIENELAGKTIKLILEITTSIQPMFGDTLKIANDSEQKQPELNDKYLDSINCNIGLIETPSLVFINKGVKIIK